MDTFFFPSFLLRNVLGSRFNRYFSTIFGSNSWKPSCQLFLDDIIYCLHYCKSMKSRVFLLLFLLITVNACPVNALELRGNTVLSYTEGPIPKNIQLYDNSTLIITGVYPETTRYNDTQTLSVDVYDNSSVLLTNSNFQGYVKLYNQSRLEMYDSSLFDARWCSGHHAFHNGSGVICYDSTLLKINSSKIGYLRGYDNSSGVITGSDVMEVNSQTNRGELFNVQFHIINSKVGRVHLYNVNSLLDG